MHKTLPRFLASLLCFVVLILLVERLFGIRFETNDDVGMMMIVHGFGVAGEATPLLLFSNLWQGLLIQALGWPFGMPGYGVYLMGALAVALAAQAAFLAELSGRWWLGVLVAAALAVRPVFSPQFTVIAGCLAAASFLALLAYQARPRLSVLLAAAALAFAAFLMRDHLFLMAALVAAPFLLRAPLLRDRRAWGVALGLVALALLARAHHQSMLAGPDWAGFVAQNLPRAIFTDFNLTPRVLESPEAMRAAGWSENDVRLIGMWWLADPLLAGPGPLRAAIDVVGVQSLFGLDAARLRYLGQEFVRMWPPMLIILLAGATLRGPGLWRLLAGCAILAVLALLITASGRLGISRVYFPALALLALMAVASAPRGRLPALLAGLAALGVLAVSLERHVGAARAAAAALPAQRAALERAAPERVHVVWGDTLPFEALYPPLARRDAMPDLRLFGIGTASYAAFSLARFGGDPMGVVNALRSPEGVSLFAYAAGVPLLRVYCAERFQGELEVEPLTETPRFLHAIFRCRRPVDDGGASR